MSGVSPLALSLIAWAVITTALIVLLMYRSLIAMREDDQLFLDPAESKLEEEQREVQARIARITPWAKGLGFASGALLIISAGMWIYQGWTRFSAP